MSRDTGAARGRADNGRVLGATNDALLKKIQALAFAKTETELYLDAHPDCAVALEYYRKIIDELEDLTEEYENTVGLIRQENESGERWSWVNKPWPWHLGEED